MLWKAILAIVSLLGSPAEKKDEQNGLFRPLTSFGPQSMSESQLAHIALHGGHEEMLRNPNGAGIKDDNTRWPGYPGKGVIPYTIDKSLAYFQDLIELAMDQYHRETCIHFVKRTNETDFVRIIRGVGCSSYVGKIGGLQVLSLGRGCDYFGTIVHELGHAIGLYHEHQRSDRDKYINVYRNNIRHGQEHNFQKTPPSEELIFTNYDHQSIMHYGEYAFSKRPGVYKTMEGKHGEPLNEPYDKPGMNENDINRIRKLYKCK